MARTKPSVLSPEYKSKMLSTGRKAPRIIRKPNKYDFPFARPEPIIEVTKDFTHKTSSLSSLQKEEILSIAIGKPLEDCLNRFQRRMTHWADGPTMSDWPTAPSFLPKGPELPIVRVDKFSLSVYQDHNSVDRKKFKELFKNETCVYFDLPALGWGIGHVMGIATGFGADAGTLALIVRPDYPSSFLGLLSDDLFLHDPSYGCFVVNVHCVDALGYCTSINVLPVTFVNK